MSLAGRHAVVTGGATGVGRAIAAALAAEGAEVTVMGRTEATLAETGHAFEVCDVTDADDVTAACARARGRAGPIDIAVANAGAVESAPFARTDPAAFQASLAVNLSGVFHLWQAALGDMREMGRGRMIAVASTAGLRGYPYVAPYCAAKHGVVGLARALARELARTGITVNAICPGFVETPMLARSIAKIAAETGRAEAEAAEALRATNPQHRFIEAEEVAAAALWLCSDAARGVNGHALSLSGGEI